MKLQFTYPILKIVFETFSAFQLTQFIKMSSSPEPRSSCSKSIQETPEVMSNYAESIIDDYDVFDPEELSNEQMFEKPRGEKRWLGRERHRGKERLHNSVKNRTFIEKTLKSDEPLSKVRFV